MSHTRPPLAWLRAAAALATLLAPLGIVGDTVDAQAANGRGFFLGNRAALTGGAGAALLSDGSSLWYNPAGLGGNTRDQVDLSASAFVLRLRDYPSLIQTTLATGEVRSNGLDGVDVLSVPAALAYTRELDDQGTSLAFGLFVPVQDRFDLESNLATNDGIVGYEHRLSFRGDATRYVGAIGVGWRHSPTVRLGVALLAHVESASLDTLLAWDVTANDPSNRAHAVTTSNDQASVTRLGLQASVGVQWDVSERWTLAAALRTPVVQMWRSVDVSSISTLSVVDQGGAADVQFASVNVDEAGFDVRLAEPPLLTLAAGWRVGEGAALSLELDLETGLEDADEEIDLSFTWNARLGGYVAVDAETTLGLGLFTDRSPDPAPSALGEEQIHFWGLSLGVERRTTIATDATDHPDGVVLVSTIAVRYAIGFGTAGGAFIDLFGPDGGRALTVDVTHHELGLHVGSGLLF